MRAVILNLHEHVLLLTVGLHGDKRRRPLAALVADGHSGGEVDVAAHAPGFKLVKQWVTANLPVWLDQLMTAPGPKADRVVYQRRRYRRPVILAAALHQNGIDAATYRAARHRGARSLAQFAAQAE